MYIKIQDYTEKWVGFYKTEKQLITVFADLFAKGAMYFSIYSVL
jgi:hypothetical protein